MDIFNVILLKCYVFTLLFYAIALTKDWSTFFQCSALLVRMQWREIVSSVLPNHQLLENVLCCLFISFSVCFYVCVSVCLSVCLFLNYQLVENVLCCLLISFSVYFYVCLFLNHHLLVGKKIFFVVCWFLSLLLLFNFSSTFHTCWLNSGHHIEHKHIAIVCILLIFVRFKIRIKVYMKIFYFLFAIYNC
jgi:hypothetical protein